MDIECMLNTEEQTIIASFLANKDLSSYANVFGLMKRYTAGLPETKVFFLDDISFYSIKSGVRHSYGTLEGIKQAALLFITAKNQDNGVDRVTATDFIRYCIENSNLYAVNPDNWVGKKDASFNKRVGEYVRSYYSRNKNNYLKVDDRMTKLSFNKSIDFEIKTNPTLIFD